MESDLMQRLITLENTILTLQNTLISMQTQIDALKYASRRNSSFRSELEEEIQDDVHCFMRLLRRLTCVKL